jgi:multiple sugar transport system substrate-binding protein
MKTRLKPFILALLCLILPAACAKKPEVDTDQPGTLKIVYVDEQTFYNEYGQLFNSKFPNVDFEVISFDEMYEFLLNNAFDNKKFYDTYAPDIVRLSSLEEYADLAESGYLADLDALIGADGYSLDSFDDNVLDLLKRPTNGKLYALAPKFDTMALYYNIDLFHKHGIEPPRDGMSWEEMFELARRFPADGPPEERIAGFSDRTHLSSLVIQMAQSEGLNLYTEPSRELTIRSEKWRSIFETILEAARSGAVYVPGVSEITNFNPEHFVQTNLFVAGRSAMTVDNLRLMDLIREFADASGQTFNYGVVTAPISSNTGMTGDTPSLYDLFGINAGSPQQQLAWEFIKYAAGEDYAKLRSKSSVQLLARASFMTEKDGVNLEPFYKVKTNVDAKPLLGAHYEVYGAFDQALQRELTKAVKGEQSIDETIEAIAQTLQEALLKIQT